MKIERHLIGEMDIAEFADQHDLTMEVRERDRTDKDRYYAKFKRVEVMEDGCLVGVIGNGATEDEAIADYANKIASKRLAVFGESSSERVNINAPRLQYATDGKK